MGIIFDDVFYDDIHNLSFEIEENKITGIVSSISFNKDKLIDLICGFDSPSDGFIYNEYRPMVLYDNLYDQFLYDNVIDNFIFYLKFYKVKNIYKRIYDSLKIVGLSRDILKRKIYDLSCSEVKKLSFSLVISVNSKVIVLDEPLKGLDKTSSDNIIKIIRLMKIRYGKTIIIFSRDSDLIHRLSDRVILFGEDIIKSGDKYDIFTDFDLIKKLNISLPKVVKFSKSVLDKKNIKLGFRDDINDLVKDIYRSVR